MPAPALVPGAERREQDAGAVWQDTSLAWDKAATAAVTEPKVTDPGPE